MLATTDGLSFSRASYYPRRSASASFASKGLSGSPFSVFFYGLLLQVYPTVGTAEIDDGELAVDVRVVLGLSFYTGMLVCLPRDVRVGASCERVGV